MYVLIFVDEENVSFDVDSIDGKTEVVCTSESVAKLKQWVKKNDEEVGYVKTKWTKNDEGGGWYGAGIEVDVDGTETPMEEGEGSYYQIIRVRNIK